MCRARIRSTFGRSRTPASTISRAPATISSAGWKMNLRRPRSVRSSPDSTTCFATPSITVAWQSWPQECITPSMVDL
jgi:hypothetical protein